jgi:hypothetical protein
MLLPRGSAFKECMQTISSEGAQQLSLSMGALDNFQSGSVGGDEVHAKINVEGN